MAHAQGQLHTQKGTCIQSGKCIGRQIHRKANAQAHKCTGRQVHWKTSALEDKCTSRQEDAWQADALTEICMAGRKMQGRQEDARAGRKKHGKQKDAWQATHRQAEICMVGKCTCMAGRKMHGRQADAWQTGRCMAGRKMHGWQEDALAGR